MSETPMCSVHLDQPAIGTCTRCGRFACSTCAEEVEPLLCGTCVMALGLAEELIPRIVLETCSSALMRVAESLANAVLLVGYYRVHRSLEAPLEPLPWRAPLQ